jgi:hypothetical protein
MYQGELMKRWKLGVFASVVAGAACQTTPPAESETKQLLGDPCSVQAPPAPKWNGTPPPLAGPGQMYIMYAPVNGYSYVALVDYQNAAIPYARQVDLGKRNTFIAATQGNYGYIVVGGNPPPPPDVIGPTLVFEAQRYSNVHDEAGADAATCALNSPPGGPIKGGF